MVKLAEDSLRRLKTDRIDLYQLHSYRDLSPLDEVIDATKRLVDSGKVRYVGCGHASDEELRQLISLYRPGHFVSCQVECNVLQPQGLRHRASFFDENHLALLPFRVLGGGVLTGKYVHRGMQVFAN
ncbi:aldo/keto reductase [Burkholderia sp. Ax-1724]|nr:aldo/keto reductase [Burkholderia sp. Ax-1724]